MAREALQAPRVQPGHKHPRRGDGLTCSGADTSHVPCKFFRSGQCQAGKACPFSHSTDSSTADTPCKYFAKVGAMLLAIRPVGP